MDALQNPTEEKNVTSVDTQKSDVYQVTAQQQAWIDYRALNGLIFDWNGNEVNNKGQVTGVPMKKMTTQEFANILGVHRDTLYEWSNRIPNFSDLVNKRRIELSGRDRLAKVHEAFFLKAASGHPTLLPLWLHNFDSNFHLPTQKIEHEIGDNMAALLRQMESDKQPEHNKVIEVEVTTNDNPHD